MTLGTIVSRLTGVIRIAVIAAVLGIAETRLTDTYNLANSAPNILYELVLGGVIGSVFVPLFVELFEKEKPERAWEVASGILNACLLILSVIAALGVIAAPWIARFYAARLDGPEADLQRQVITFLLRLFIPQLVLYGLYFVVAAMLNARKHFGSPMYTPILNNLVAIGVFVAFHHIYGRVGLASVTNAHLWFIGLGTTASIAPMGLALLPVLARHGSYRFTLSLDHPAVKKLARLSVFVVGFVAANQIGYVVIQWLANAQQGGFSAYIAAFTFFLLPVGLFIWSLTTALLPSLSEDAVNAEWDDYRDRLSMGMRGVLFLMLPSAVGYLVLGRPIVEVLLQHGVVTARSSELVTIVLRFLTLGLVQFSLFQLLTRAFYALQDTKTPFLINCVTIAVNTAINVPMFVWLGVQGLAAGQTIAYTFGSLAQARALSSRIGGIGGWRVANSAMRIAGAAAAMGAVVWVARKAMERAVPAGLAGTALALAVSVTAGVLSYLALCYLLKVEELGYLRGLLKRRPTPAEVSSAP